MDTGKRHLASLDSLRGAGVILIFANHFVGGMPYILFGWIGLWIFFALSGFLITDGLLKMKTLPIGQYIGRFYMKRAFRILPAFIIFFSISVALYFIFPRQGFAGNSDLSHYWIYLVTFTFNHYPPIGGVWFPHLWSLSLEEQFYLVWPWLVFFLPTNWVKRIVLCWIFVAPALRLILPSFFADLPVQTWLVCQADALAIGGYVAIFRHKLPGPGQSKKLLWIVTALIMFIGLVNYLTGAPAGESYWRTLGLAHQDTFNYQYVWRYSLINVWAAILILCCLQGTAPAFLNFRPLVFLGRISYGCYLSHLPLLGVYLYFLRPIHAFTLRGFVIFVIWFSNVILISWLSFRYIEQPLLRIKNKLGRKGPRVPVATPLVRAAQ